MENIEQNILPIGITENAKKELQKLMKEQDLSAHPFLRIGVKGGGCSGLSYQLGFDKKKEYDEVYEWNEIQIVMNKAHKLYLENMVIDFSNGLDARGFTFENPNASSTCGCGTSFAV